jgi:hypothetical protein
MRSTDIAELEERWCADGEDWTEGYGAVHIHAGARFVTEWLE